MYNASGWVVHHNTDMWGDSAPQDNWFDSTWFPTSGAWLASQMMEYYRFTGDSAFLAGKYSTIKGAAEYFNSFVTDYNGWKVTNPTLSPENDYYIPGTNETKGAMTLGSTIDNSLLRELFGVIKEAQNVLNNDGAFVEETQNIKSQLPPLQVNSNGGIMEWIHDYEEVYQPIQSRACCRTNPVVGRSRTSPLFATCWALSNE